MELEMVVGCMYSKKTEYLIKQIESLKKEGKSIAALKPIQDYRYSKNDIVAHSGIRTKAVAIEEMGEIYEFAEGVDVLVIDEIQFIENWDFIDVVEEFLQRDMHILLAGLDKDFRGNPYGVVPQLMAKCDTLIKLYGVCRVCGAPASFSQRLVNGFPAHINDPIYIVSPDITYEPRCRRHHEISVK
jgi:thymidine kinase